MSTPNNEIKGRGTGENPKNRFEKIQIELDAEALYSDEDEGSKRGPKTEFFDDLSESVITENNSPDIPYRWSINPYRGCEHGCSYCYARPYHEFLGLNAGLDFEQKIIVKRKAPELVRQWISKPKWTGERLALSGVTDPYQPVEAKLKITRQILEIMLQTQHCVTMITKNALIARDIDLLSELAQKSLTGIAISITTLDADLARIMEPRTSSPAARFRTARELSAAGIPVHVNIAPMIPGLNDHELPQLIQTAADHGARSVGMQIVRLPGAVADIFANWLEQHYSTQKEKILNRIRATREGKLNNSDFKSRMRGSGILAESIIQTFKIWSKRCKLDGGMPKLDESKFIPPSGQLRLF
ncbi:MAG: PA0069 family radical SAM protein [Planctomycetes bacterium]|nr:PA0069 family radical SAM protein [Planctomycetota bacterium]